LTIAAFGALLASIVLCIGAFNAQSIVVLYQGDYQEIPALTAILTLLSGVCFAGAFSLHSTWPANRYAGLRTAQDCNHRSQQLAPGRGPAHSSVRSSKTSASPPAAGSSVCRVAGSDAPKRNASLTGWFAAGGMSSC
jgi:hypothetical protein